MLIIHLKNIALFKSKHLAKTTFETLEFTVVFFI